VSPILIFDAFQLTDLSQSVVQMHIDILVEKYKFVAMDNAMCTMFITKTTTIFYVTLGKWIINIFHFASIPITRSAKVRECSAMTCLISRHSS
jgi:hypothetical protein